MRLDATGLLILQSSVAFDDFQEGVSVLPVALLVGVTQNLVGHVAVDHKSRLANQHALGQMGLEPEAAVMVGDSLRGDVEGAQALGMTAVWRRPPPRGTKEAADRPALRESIALDYVIDTLGELKSLPIFQ